MTHKPIKVSATVFDDCPYIEIQCSCGSILGGWGRLNAEQKYFEHQFDMKLQEVLSKKKLK